MRATGKILPLLLFPLVFSSCSNGDVSELFRSYDDPYDETPAADCYSVPCVVKLSWGYDECADTYALLRAGDDGTETFTEIYSGTASSYADTFTANDDQRRVLYRLDKTRGNRRLEGSDCACAVVSARQNDLNEPNGSPGTATEMLRIITATMPCGQFIYRDRAVEDEDWYYIRLKPLCKAYVEFSQLDIDSSVAETCFLFAEQGGLPREVGNRTKIVIENTELHDRRVCFRIYPDMGKLFGGVPGSAVPAYRMELSEEVYK